MSVTALLRVPGDWKTLIGWIDLQTGQIAAPQPRWHFFRFLFFIAWFALVLIILGNDVLQPETPQIILGAMGAAFIAYLARVDYKKWQQASLDAKALQAIAVANAA